MMRLHLPTSLLLLTFSTLLVTVAESFIIGGPKEIVTPNPDLLRFTEAQTGTLLNIRMDVAEAGLEAETRMGINGMTFELSDEAVEATKQNYPKLPGVNGPNPHLSSGSRKIKVHQEGSFIGMNGETKVRTLSGCWEMIWRNDAPAGSVICAFDLPETYKRGDAMLEKGPLYITFPVWTRGGLSEAQEDKRNVEERLAVVKKKLDAASEKMNETQNPIMKALHFREACQAHEERSFIHTEKAASVPWDDEVEPLNENLLLTTKGLVWSKGKSQNLFQGLGWGMSTTNDKVKLLGTALIK